MLDRGTANSPVEFDDLRNSVQVSHKVENQHVILGCGDAQSPAKLLNKDPPTVGDPHEDDQVDVWEVDAFVEEVDRRQEIKLPGLEARQQGVAFPRRVVR